MDFSKVGGFQAIQTMGGTLIQLLKRSNGPSSPVAELKPVVVPWVTHDACAGRLQWVVICWLCWGAAEVDTARAPHSQHLVVDSAAGPVVLMWLFVEWGGEKKPEETSKLFKIFKS